MKDDSNRSLRHLSRKSGKDEDRTVVVDRLFCEECRTEVCGDFELPVLARLSDKEQQFILAFVKSSGSLKDMAKSMGVSYPTVRNILDDLIDKLSKMNE